MERQAPVMRVALAQDETFTAFAPLAMCGIAVGNLPAAPTAEPSPAVTETPEPTTSPNYLFVEDWTDFLRGPGCELSHIDFPFYRFNVQTGVMALMSNENPRLESDDVGYLGYGHSLSGHGGGSWSFLQRVTDVPWSPESFGPGIESVSDAGSVIVASAEGHIELEPGGAWRTSWSFEEEFHPECTITATLTLSNYGWQDRAKIEYH